MSIFGVSMFGYPNFEPRPAARIRFYREFTINQTHALHDHCRSLPKRLRFCRLQRPFEREAFPVIFDRQQPMSVGLGKPYQALFCLGVLAYIDESFLDDAR